MEKYKDLTLEDLEKAITEFYDKMPQKEKDDVFVKELTADEIETLRHTLGNFAIDGLGDRIFRLPGGAITGIGGVARFNAAFKEQTFKYLPKRTTRPKRYKFPNKRDGNGKR